MAREEDHDEVVLLGRTRQEGAESPLEVAQRGLPLGLVGDQQHVFLLESALAYQHLLNQLGVRHRVLELGDRGAVVAPDADHHRPLLAAGFGYRRRGHGGLNRGRPLVDHRADLLADGAVGLGGTNDDGIGAFSKLDGRRDRQ